MTVKLLVGDVRDRIREIPDGSVDLVACSPPFLALRKYGDNAAEMGSERTPADFLDALLELTQEFRRVLAPHGSIAIELGDTYSGSGGAGGDYNEGGLRDGQAKFDGSALRGRSGGSDDSVERRDDDSATMGSRSNARFRAGYLKGDGRKTAQQADYDVQYQRKGGGAGWPLAKSLTLIPTLYPASLAYGWNILNPAHTFDRWRVRNVIVWARPNPPVGALGDKVRPATSYITVACVSSKRYFDLDGVRSEPTGVNYGRQDGWSVSDKVADKFKETAPDNHRNDATDFRPYSHPAGAPPLDWWEDDDPTGHATLVLPTQPYPGAHYATWPEALASRLIKMMCPVGGMVLDPFAGSGTTLAVAQGLARDATGIELYEANAELVRQRVGLFLEIDGHVA